jgi:hypothetical protein
MPLSVGAARFAWLLSWFLEQGRNHLLLAGLPILLALGALCIGRYIVARSCDGHIAGTDLSHRAILAID